MLHCRPNALSTARVGIVVAKRLARRAHVRNLVKRIVRELFRRNRTRLPSLDLIFRLSAPVEGATRATINADVAHLLERLQR